MCSVCICYFYNNVHTVHVRYSRRERMVAPWAEQHTQLSHWQCLAAIETYMAEFTDISRDLRIVFSFESNLESNRPSDSFSNRIFESNRPYTTQAVTQPNGLQAYRTACYRPIICWRLALWTCVLYLIHRYFVFVTNESDVRPTELRTEYLFISIQS